ncbi:MAG: hypothetical protein QNJ54_22300 [Prochloraceae cyanobacterium]|nr:hypothetical protein [Prochloraceae cyanobacterium]
MSEEKTVKKSISLSENLAKRIKKYSEKEKRSFSAQMALWAEKALEKEELDND